MQINRFFSIVASILLFTIGLNAQLVNTPFGQNRIQYEKFKWLRYESPNFSFSFTEDNENLMHYAVPLAESGYQEIKAILEYQVRQKIEIIIYSDFSDYAQSNVGLASPSMNIAGNTKLLDNKILIYFDGNHQNLNKQIREGIARSILNRMLFGSNLQELVQNSVLLNLPEWYTEGLLAYCTEEWNSKLDDELRDAIFSKKYDNFLELAGERPVLAGQSLFHYIARNHGSASISNLLYLTRVNRSVESGFLYVFGATFYTIAGTNWYNFYTGRYNEDNKGRLFPNAGELEFNHKKNAEVKQIKISPDGKYLVYSEHLKGEQWVKLYQIETKKISTIWSGGVKDYTEDVNSNYPILCWKNNSKNIQIIFEKAEKIYISDIDVSNPKSKENNKQIKGLETVTSASQMENGDLLLSGFNRGYSNLYLYKGSEVRPLTNDKWDDIDATEVKLNGKSGIIFSSNRPESKLKTTNSDKLPDGQFDLFYYEIGNIEGNIIKLTSNVLSNEKNPQAVNSEYFSFLSDDNGISNRFIGNLDTALDYYQSVIIKKGGERIALARDSSYSGDMSEVDSTIMEPVYSIYCNNYSNTNYSRNILEQTVSKNGLVADLIYRDGRYHIFVRELKIDRASTPEKTKFRLIQERQAGLISETDNNKVSKKTEDKKVIEKQIAEELEKVNQEIDSNIIEVKKDSSKELSPIKSIDTTKVDIDNYMFQSEFKEVINPKKTDEVVTNKDSLNNVNILNENKENVSISKPEERLVKDSPKPVLYSSDRKTKYKNIFKVDELTFQLDNTPLFWGMDLFFGNNYRFPNLGLVAKTSFTDIFEDYKLDVGIRMPVNLNGMEYFLSFEDRKHRLDKKISIYRRGRMDNYVITDTLTGDDWPARGRNIKHMVMAEFRYPLSKFSSVQGTLSYQTDKVAIISENRNSLSVPVYNFSQAGIRAEYIFDNSIPLLLNARKGTRARFYADYFQNIESNTIDDQYKISILKPTFVMGFDARHYISFDNKTVFAFRGVGAASFGKYKMLYSMGGMENWLFPRFNETIPLPDASNFTYQVIATPLRGFQSNIRNGNNFLLINAEIRIPVTQYLTRNQPSNVLLRNLQLVGFYDIGSAWQGFSPFSKDNPMNSTLIDPGSGSSVVSPIRVRVNYFRRPIVQGAGFGLRTIFLGYFMRLDYAWGIETGQIQTPRVYLSLGMDF